MSYKQNAYCFVICFILFFLLNAKGQDENKISNF